MVSNLLATYRARRPPPPPHPHFTHIHTYEHNCTYRPSHPRDWTVGPLLFICLFSLKLGLGSSAAAWPWLFWRLGYLVPCTELLELSSSFILLYAWDKTVQVHLNPTLLLLPISTTYIHTLCEARRFRLF
jgi:hypothetical protein